MTKTEKSRRQSTPEFEAEPLDPVLVVDRALVGARDEIAAGTVQAAGVGAFVRFVEDVVGVGR